MARPVDVRAVLEDEVHLRQSKLGERAQFRQTGDACHLVLNRERDELLDFLWRKRRHGSVDLHLDVGDVRHGINRQPQCGVNTDADHDQGGEQHEHALANGEFKEAVEHSGPYLPQSESDVA